MNENHYMQVNRVSPLRLAEEARAGSSKYLVGLVNCILLSFDTGKNFLRNFSSVKETNTRVEYLEKKSSASISPS